MIRLDNVHMETKTPSFFQEAETYTLGLVGVPSINGTKGEANVALKIMEYIGEFDYFRRHSSNLWSEQLPGDKLGRINVFALVKGGKCTDGRTVILHGHLDTVGIDDFGALSPYAFNPPVLMQKLKEMTLDDDIKADLASGDWLFGRGSNDMKSGLAAHMVVLKRLSENADNLTGNVLFMANPVEENHHSGMIASLKTLTSLMQREKLQFITAVNNDYTTPLFAGDKNNYVYEGASGKLLPCFYIAGIETHVGQCFEGLDPNLIAANIVKSLDMDQTLCDGYEGEYTMPPTVLKLTDLKSSYNVQTPTSTFLYFNYYVNQTPVCEILEKLRKRAYDAFAQTIESIGRQQQLYSQKMGIAYRPRKWEPLVLAFSELYKLAKQKSGAELDRDIDELVIRLLKEGVDARKISLEIVRLTCMAWGEKKPVIVLFFAPPYCPNNILGKEKPQEAAVSYKLRETVNEINNSFPVHIKVMHYYPSLSDSSYIKIDDSRESITALFENFPGWKQIYPLPVDVIKSLDIPAVTLGTFGKDAHKMTERVYKPYTFGVLPQLEMSFVKSLLQ